ncbi:MAG: M48 family metallopeptidase [Verrucomicrobiae bacterium]|nr:M48 family metallopeptidase [Verrucomicrobiae bacterium]
MKKRRFSPRAFLTALLICIGLAACYTVPQTGRKAFNVVSPETEIKLGLKSFEEIKHLEHISSNAVQIAAIKRVGEQIAAVANPDIPNAKWEFVLFESKEPNAFALPGGKVGVYTGILPITMNDGGLAAVIGHEVAHVAARHGAERISEQMAMAGLATGLAIGLSGEDSRTRNLALLGFGVATTVGAVLPHSRLQEREADRIGLTYMAKAGYDPKEAVAFWQRFMEYNRKQGGRPPAFLSTHPTDESRIASLQSLLPEAEVYYQTSGRR